MIVHGKGLDNTDFRYVWARPKDKPNHRFHIAKRHSSFSQGMYAGKTSISCMHGPWDTNFNNNDVEFHEWGTAGIPWERCYYCGGDKKDIDEKITAYNETLPPAVHGKLYGTAFRYVWARPSGKWQMRYHIARMFEGDFVGGTSTKLKGTVQFLCSHYQGSWKRTEVNIKEWNNLPKYYDRCDFCSGHLEKYEGLVFNALDNGVLQEHDFQQHTDLATLNQAKGEQKKPDEEDIGVDKPIQRKDDYNSCDTCYSNTCKCNEREKVKKCLQNNVGMGRNNILPPYIECVKCKRRYAINVGTYIPLDGTGIRLREYTDHADTGEFVRMYLCVCDHPVVFRTKKSITALWLKFLVGKPVVK